MAVERWAEASNAFVSARRPSEPVGCTVEEEDSCRSSSFKFRHFLFEEVPNSEVPPSHG